jgi:hypothetical protein
LASKDPVKEFTTHKNYIECLHRLSVGLKIDNKQRISKKSITFVANKDQLIDLTKQSLQSEYKIVRGDRDYASAAIAWLPIKSYYLIFYLIMKVDYLYNLNENIFTNAQHQPLVNRFTERIKEGKLFFSSPLFNRCFDQSVLLLTFPSGANLKKNIPDEDRYNQLMKKIGKDKLDCFCRKYQNLKRSALREKKDIFLQDFQLSIFDFFYQMRLRTNYRDICFIEGIPQEEIQNYYCTYYSFTFNFVEALEGLIEQLQSSRRTGRNS